MASSTTTPGSEWGRPPGVAGVGVPPAVLPGGAPGALPIIGATAASVGRPPGVPVGATLMVGAGGGAVASPLPSMTARAAIGRSLPMLRAVRGTVAVSVVLGLIVTALPFLVSAAQGPVMVLFGGAGQSGGLQHIWGLSAALFNVKSGLLHGLSTPLSFAWLLAIWTVSLVMVPVLGFGRAWADAQVQWRLLTDIRQRVHDHMESLSLDFFTGVPGGMLMQRIQVEISGVQRLLSDCFIAPCIDSAVLGVVLVIMVSLSWQMTMVTLALSPFALMALAWSGKRLQAATQRMIMSNRNLGGELGETISGISDIQVFDAEKRRSERFYDANKAAARNSSLMLVWAQGGVQTAGIFIALSTVLVLIAGVAFGGATVLGQKFALPPATLLQFVFVVPAIFPPTQRIIQAYTTYKSVLPQVASTYQLLDTRPSVEERPGSQVLVSVQGNIVFEDVVFGYSPQQRVLNGLSLSIKNGETVAIVGAIGCGKSTVFNLLLRFLDPESGRIMLDGRDITEVTLNSLREQVSKLSQFPFYLKDTIRENVRLGRQDATDAEVEEACKQGLIHSVIIDPTKLPNGYDTVVDVQVPSGGQKRLIALARCLLRKPEVLLLDEPTENLDADERLALTGVIRDYARDRTCIVISHDMDFIKAVADRIIVLDGGRVAEEGTHDELVAKGGLYKELQDAQNINPALVRRPTPTAGQGMMPTGAPVGAMLDVLPRGI